MRTIPPDMLEAFQAQQGVNPLFIIEITWPGSNKIRYSTCEFDGQEIFPYVKEFQDFESVSHVEGLGAVSTMTVEFFDQFGHFKEKMDTVDFFTDTTVIIYLTLDGVELYDLFEGVIADNATWSNNIFTVEVKSKNLEKEVGYQPSIDDIDEGATDPTLYAYYENNLNSSGVWPSIYGTVKNYPAPILSKQRYATVTKTVPFSDLGTYYELPIDNADDFTLDFTYTVNLTGKSKVAFSILGTGTFTINDDGDVVFRLMKDGITSEWYQDIPYTILDNNGITENLEESVTRIQIAPGTFVLDDLTELTTLGPDGLPTTDVWLQFMSLTLSVTGVISSNPDAEAFATLKFYYNCVDQSGDICTLNAKLGSFFTDGFDLHITSAKKLNGTISEIPENTQIYILGDSVTYMADTKSGTTINTVSIRDGDEIREIDPSLYTVSSSNIWTGSHPANTRIVMLAEVYMRFLEHYSRKNKEGEGVLISATSSTTTIDSVIGNISGLTTITPVTDTLNFPFLTVEDAQDVIPEIAWQSAKAVRYTRANNVDILELIDLTDVASPPIHLFTENNVLLGSIVYGYTSKDDLYTVFNAEFQTNDLDKELETVKYKKNVSKYEESLLDVDYYIYKDKTDVENRFSYWRDKLSDYHYTIQFTGFMDAFGLEVWDRVEVDLNTSSFYDPTQGTPFTNTHTSTPQKWYSTGRVKRMTPNILEGTIEFEIELDTITGYPATNTYRRAIY